MFRADPKLMEKAPEILALLRDLMQQQTGLQYLETVLRYLFSIVEGLTTEEMREVVARALSQREGDHIMTRAEKLHKDGLFVFSESTNTRWCFRPMHLPISP